MKKVILSLVLASLTMFSCSSSGDNEMEESSDDKHEFTVNYTQSGDMEESIVVFVVLGMNGGMVASNILDDDNKIVGSSAIINMSEKEEGTFSYKIEDKVNAVYLTLSSSINNDAKKDYECNITVTRDGKEVFNHDEIFEIGASITSRSFVVE